MRRRLFPVEFQFQFQERERERERVLRPRLMEVSYEENAILSRETVHPWPSLITGHHLHKLCKTEINKLWIFTLGEFYFPFARTKLIISLSNGKWNNGMNNNLSIRFHQPKFLSNLTHAKIHNICFNIFNARDESRSFRSAARYPKFIH